MKDVTNRPDSITLPDPITLHDNACETTTATVYPIRGRIYYDMSGACQCHPNQPNVDYFFTDGPDEDEETV